MPINLTMKVILSILILTVFNSKSIAQDRANLMLRGLVPSSISTKISQIEMSSLQSMVKISSQINSKRITEGQRFEIVGLDQLGLSGQIKLVEGSNHSVSYELIIKNLKSSLSKDKPIFLKISAN